MFWIYVLQKTRGKYASNSLLYLKLLWNQEAKQPGLISHVQILKCFLSWNIFSYHLYKKKKTEVNLPLFLQYLQDCELENLEVQQKPALLIVRCVQRRQLVLTYRRKIHMEITNKTLDNERVEDHLAWENKQHFATPPIRHPGLSWMLRDPWGPLTINDMMAMMRMMMMMMVNRMVVVVVMMMMCKIMQHDLDD